MRVSVCVIYRFCSALSLWHSWAVVALLYDSAGEVVAISRRAWDFARVIFRNISDNFCQFLFCLYQLLSAIYCAVVWDGFVHWVTSMLKLVDFFDSWIVFRIHLVEVRTCCIPCVAHVSLLSRVLVIRPRLLYCACAFLHVKLFLVYVYVQCKCTHRSIAHICMCICTCVYMYAYTYTETYVGVQLYVPSWRPLLPPFPAVVWDLWGLTRNVLRHRNFS